MDSKQAIISFSQSEKLKAGIIWASQALNILQGLNGVEKRGAEEVIVLLIHMIGQEAKLAKSVSGDSLWDEVSPYFEKAVMMIDSGVGEEATLDLSKALSRVTNVGQRSMMVLREEGLI